MTEIGTCRLCLNTNVELKDSHILPRFLYREMYCKDFPVKHPVHMSGGIAVSRSNQLKQHLLCESCERRFSAVERYVSDFTYRQAVKHHLPLLDHLLPTLDGGLDLQRLGPTVDPARLGYFGVSVIWRASIARCAPGCKLGPEYEDRIRQYLNGEKDFPANAAILLWAFRPDHGEELAMSSVSEPCTQHFNMWGDCDAHHFYCHGLMFTLQTGEHLPPHAAACLLSAAPRVFVRDQERFVDIVVQSHRGTVARGALANLPVDES